MKMLLSIILLMASFSLLNAQQWSEMRLPKPWEDNLLATTFANEVTAVSVGENGTIRRTTDTGYSWSMMQVDGREHLRSVYFIDEANGICVGDLGAIYRTSDTGLTWKKVTIATEATLYSVHGIGNFLLAVGSNGTYLRSIDRGKTWNMLSFPSSIGFHAVRSISQNIVLAVGENGTIFRSTDNGLQWIKITTKTPQDLLTITQSKTGKLITAGGGGQILVSIDSALTWTYTTIDTTFSIHSIYFRDTSHCVLFANRKSSSRTNSWISNDGATTWNSIGIMDFKINNGIISQDGQTEIVVGDKSEMVVNKMRADSSWVNKIYASGGATNLTSIGKVGKSIVTAGNRFYYTSKDSTGYQIIIFRSPDNGTTWEAHPISYPLTDYWKALTTTTVGSSTIIIGGDKGILLISNDTGHTWSVYQLPTAKLVSSVSFYDQFHGVATIGDHNTVFRTADGGKSWHLLKVPASTNDRFIKLAAYGDSTELHLYAITFLPNSKVSRSILTTLDNGDTWIEKPLESPSEEWVRMFFKDRLHGFAIGHSFLQNATISIVRAYKTEDGGLTWDKVLDKNLTQGDAITEAHAVDNQYGVAVSGKGAVFASTNFGKNWQESSKFTKSEIGVSDAIYVPASTMLLVGSFGRIFRLDSVALGTSIEVHDESAPIIYPNPATNRLTVRVPTIFPANISLYTIDGIRVLNQDIQGVNTYSIYIGDITPGIYISYLSHRQGSYTHKVIITR